MNDYEEDDFFDENENFSQRLGGNQFNNLGNARESSVAAAYRRLSHNVGMSKLREEPDPDDLVDVLDEKTQSDSSSKCEPDPDDTSENDAAEMNPDHSWITSNSRDPSAPEHHSGSIETTSDMIAHPAEDDDESDPDDLEIRTSIGEVENMKVSDDTVMQDENLNADEIMNATPGSDDNLVVVTGRETVMEVDEPDPDDQEIQRIQDSVTIISNRLKKPINALKTELSPGQATNELQMLLKIVRYIVSSS